MSVFGNIKRTEPLNEVVNFENFGSSFLLLFRIMTSAGWNDILDPLMLQPPDCDPNYKNLPNGNCGYKLVSILFLVSFIVVIFLILINMYIAIILENYNQVMQQEKIGITNEDIDLFYQQWEIYDPNATQFIEYKDLSDFVHRLEGNLRIPKPNKAACALMDIPLVNGSMIHCLDLMQALVKRIVSRYEDVNSEGFQLIMQKMEERFRAAFPSRERHVTTHTTMEMNRQLAAVRVIIRAIRQYRERKLLNALQAHILEEKGKVNTAFTKDDEGSNVSVIAEANDKETNEQEVLSHLDNQGGTCCENNEQSEQVQPLEGLSPTVIKRRGSVVAWDGETVGNNLTVIGEANEKEVENVGQVVPSHLDNQAGIRCDDDVQLLGNQSPKEIRVRQNSKLAWTEEHAENSIKQPYGKQENGINR